METKTGLTLSDVPYEAIVLEKQLKRGMPTLGWRGDPRLYLEMGVITSNNTGYSRKVNRFVRHGEVLARQLIVMRHCEDGTEQVILRKGLNKVHEVIPALIKHDPRTPGFEEVMDTVEREDNAKQKEVSTQIFEARAQCFEHLSALVGDRQNGRTTHRQVGGFDERPDRNLAKPPEKKLVLP
jgi:hypothetical protein